PRYGRRPPARHRTRNVRRWAWPAGRSARRPGWTVCNAWRPGCVAWPAVSAGCRACPAVGPGHVRCRRSRHARSADGGRSVGRRTIVDSRERILAAVRSATRDAIDPAPTRDYRTEVDDRELAGRDLVELFVERVDDHRGEVHVVDTAELPLRVGQVLGAHKVRSLVVPHDVDARWLSTTHARLVRDDPSVTAQQLDDVDAVVTGCAAAVAVTGTIVLDSGPRQGRRAIT